MLVSYIVLVLCTIALVGTAIALFLRVRAHMSKTADSREEQEQHQDSGKS
jgi:hypothetical protein